MHALFRWFLHAPARLVRAGLWMFFAGSAGLACAALAHLLAGDASGGLEARFPDLPTWFIPESPLALTASTAMVAWGVWAMGAGLRRARASRRR